MNSAELGRKSSVPTLLTLGIILTAALILFFVGLGRLPLLEPDEGRNAEVGREMASGSGWLTPRYDGMAYLDKPAVFFWMEAASFKMFGVSEKSARLPSAIMALGTMLLVWFLARRMFGHSVGLRSALIFAACPLSVILAREVIFDMTLAFQVTLALTAFWLLEECSFRKSSLVALMFGAMGIAIITKGFVGILLPLVAILIYYAAGGRAREWLKMRWKLGLPIMLAMALPWFIAVSLRNPDFPRYAFWNESLQRFTTASSHRGGGIFYYIPVFLGGFFPWSLFLLLAGWNRLRRWKELKLPENRAILFLLAWAVWVFALFTISHSKLPTYFMPAIPALSILMGRAWQDVGRQVDARSPDWLTAGFALLLAIGVLVAAASHSWIYASLHTRLLKKLTPEITDLIQPSLLYTGLFLAAIGYLGRRLATQLRGRMLALGTFSLAIVIFPMMVIRWYAPLRLLTESHSSKGLAAEIEASPDRDAPIYGYYYYRTSLPFYLRRPVGLLSVKWGETTSNYLPSHQALARAAGEKNAGRGILLSVPEFQAMVKSNTQPILIVTPNHLVENLWTNAGRLEPLWSRSDYSVWRIPPANAKHHENTPTHVVPPFQP